jgi:hypothetical protein
MILKQFSFELRILMKKRRRKIEEFKSSSGVRKRLTFVVPAQEAKGGQPLAPILGQVQLNTMEFVNSFNAQSVIFNKGFPVFVELLVKWDTSYSFSFLPFPFFFFIDKFIFKIKNQSFIFLFDVLRLGRIHRFLYGSIFTKFVPQLLSLFHSLKVKIFMFSRSSFYNYYCTILAINKPFFLYYYLQINHGIPYSQDKNKISKKIKTSKKS